jgi:secreted PhoX family phosphatase
MMINRRNFLLFVGTTAGISAIESLAKGQDLTGLSVKEKGISPEFSSASISTVKRNFQAVKLPLPLAIDGISPEAQVSFYSTYTVIDDLVLPEGYTYDIVASWGDRVGDSRFGYNNDYLALVETSPGEGFLTVNFEYISGKVWMESYTEVIGKQLPLAEVKEQLLATEGEIDAYSLGNQNKLKQQIVAIAREGAIDLGIGIISVRRNNQGKWERTYSQSDRRITGISGLDNPRQSLKATGAATSIFNKTNKLGYEDGLASRIIGTFQNCAGGTTPWGTVLSAEENFQHEVPEAVMADGSSMLPQAKPFKIDDSDLEGNANVFGLAGNKYGWMVEVDPANPQDYGTKHTWLGRYRHEAFGIRAEAGKQLAVYSGCDRRGGHLYKFISQEKIIDPKDKQNSDLFERGMLYGAKFNTDGSGSWIPLTLDTAIDPVVPSQVAGGMVTLPNPDRPVGGFIEANKELDIELFKRQFKTLGDLYLGDSDLEKQGAILIDAHFAASAVGVTCTGRPEDTVVDRVGRLFIAFTSGTSGSDGGADLSIFQGPNGETDYEYGWVMKLEEDNGESSSLSFRWQMMAIGGESANGGAGFANPDNLELDAKGNFWITTDISTSKHNFAVADRIEDGQPLSGRDLTGVFGNNSIWHMTTSGEIYPFAIAPMECECTGPKFSSDNQTLFIAIQHPGEENGIRKDMKSETREFALLTTDGKIFQQQRLVPIGSNWPGKKANQAPRPSVIAIRKIDGSSIS